MSFKVISVVLYILLLGRWKYPLDSLRIKSNIKPLLSHLEVIKKKRMFRIYGLPIMCLQDQQLALCFQLHKILCFFFFDRKIICFEKCKESEEFLLLWSCFLVPSSHLSEWIYCLGSTELFSIYTDNLLRSKTFIFCIIPKINWFLTILAVNI